MRVIEQHTQASYPKIKPLTSGSVDERTSALSRLFDGALSASSKATLSKSKPSNTNAITHQIQY